jgi:hypothetical protein
MRPSGSFPSADNRTSTNDIIASKKNNPNSTGYDNVMSSAEYICRLKLEKAVMPNKMNENMKLNISAFLSMIPSFRK